MKIRNLSLIAVVITLFAAMSLYAQQPTITCQGPAANQDVPGLLDIILQPCIANFNGSATDQAVSTSMFYATYTTKNTVTASSLTLFLFTGSIVQEEMQVSIQPPPDQMFSDGTALKRYVLSFGRVSQTLDTTKQSPIYPMNQLKIPTGSTITVWYLSGFPDPIQNCSATCGWSGEIIIQ